MRFTHHEVLECYIMGSSLLGLAGQEGILARHDDLDLGGGNVGIQPHIVDMAHEPDPHRFVAELVRSAKSPRCSLPLGLGQLLQAVQRRVEEKLLVYGA